MDIKEFITGNRGKVLPNEFKGFNWGAFLLTFIWGIRFKAWITLLAIPLIWFQMPLGLNWILFTALQVYCGLKGNEWAYQVEWWKTSKDFHNTQIKWAASAVALSILIPLAVLLLAARFIQKSPDNPLELVENAQCSISYKKIKQELPNIRLSANTTPINMAEQFAARFKNTRQDGNSVIFSIKDGKNNLELYNIMFTKIDGSQPCSMSLKNCIITSSYSVKEHNIMGTKDCVFYFDNRADIKPDERTKEAIDKGFNILKYL